MGGPQAVGQTQNPISARSKTTTLCAASRIPASGVQFQRPYPGCFCSRADPSRRRTKAFSRVHDLAESSPRPTAARLPALAPILEVEPSRRRPVYFGVFSPAEFERTESQTPSFNADRELGSSSRQLGESMTLSLVFLVLSGAGVLAWRNFRLGRGDRKGAFRVAFFIFCAGMLRWL